MSSVTRSILGCLTLATALVALPGAFAKGREQININRAEASFGLGEFAEADEMAGLVLDGEPQSFRALSLRGHVAVLENRLDEAEQFLQQALAVRPTHRETRALLAEVYYRRDRFAEAAPLFESIGDEAEAAKLAAFGERQPYRARGERAVLPFLQTDPLPVVELSINGSEPAAFILDTGGGELILDREWAAELGVESVGTSRGTFGGDQRAVVDHGAVGAVGLGDLVLRNVPVQMLDTSPFSRVAPGHEIRGILGTVLLYHFRPTIDYPGGRLVLEPRRAHPGEASEDPEGTVRVPFWLAGDHLIVAHGRVNDADPLLFLVDTGLAGAAFTCPQSTLTAAGVELVPQAASSGVGGGGEVTVVPFLLERLRLGAVERTQMPGLFGAFPASLEHGKGFRIGGLVSHAFFRPFAVTFDFDAMEIIVSGTG